MSKALAAHRRLMASLPKERVTTHTRRVSTPGKGHATAITPELIAFYRALKKAGRRYDEICRELRVGSATLARLKELANG